MQGNTGKGAAQPPDDLEDIGMDYPVITEVYGGEDMMDDPDVQEVLASMDDEGTVPTPPPYNATEEHQPGKPRRGVHVHVHTPRSR